MHSWFNRVFSGSTGKFSSGSGRNAPFSPVQPGIFRAVETLYQAISFGCKTIPVITVQNVERIYSGVPFTSCQAKSLNHQTGDYNEQTCLMYLLYSQLSDKCNCYLPYVDVMNTFARFHNYSQRVGLTKNRKYFYNSSLLLFFQTLLSPCTFTQHAFCAAELVRSFHSSDRELCPLACKSNSYERTSIQVQ